MFGHIGGQPTMLFVKNAVLWDFGGVILSSPFEAFNRYETDNGLPIDFLRSVNAVNAADNAWARLERNHIDATEFDELFATESAALGHRVPGGHVLGLLHGEVRPEMVDALDRVRDLGYRTACLTNNVVGGDGVHSAHGNDRSATIAAVMARFDVVVESSKVGVRKPEPRFYEIACELLGVAATECVFLDDLGINLKPAAAMGMTTIKVTSPAQAIDDLRAALGLDDSWSPNGVDRGRI
jgi:putative hydrolase of the HAD superfamily